MEELRIADRFVVDGKFDSDDDLMFCVEDVDGSSPDITIWISREEVRTLVKHINYVLET